MVYGGQLFVSEATKFNVVEEVFTVECNQMDVICNSFALNESMNIFTLNEGAFQTIIAKIKELWSKFIAWLKKIWEKIKSFFSGKKKMTKEELTALGKEINEKGLLKKEVKVYIVDAEKVNSVIADIKTITGKTDKKTELLISHAGAKAESYEALVKEYADALKDTEEIRKKLSASAIVEVSTKNFEYAHNQLSKSFAALDSISDIAEGKKQAEANKKAISKMEKEIKDLEKKIAEIDKKDFGKDDKYDQNAASAAASEKKEFQDKITSINKSIQGLRLSNQITYAIIGICKSIEADLRKSAQSIATATHASAAAADDHAKGSTKGEKDVKESVSFEESTDLSFLDI